jgi:acyl carrier protein
MPAETDIAIRIRTALADYLKRDVKTIKPSDALRNDLGLDSMATIELVYQIEDAFDVQILDKDLQTLVTVANVTAYVEGKVGKVTPARPAAAKPPSPRPKTKKKR